MKSVMSRIQWSDELSVGVKEVDDQHKELINIANTLLGAVESGGGRKVTDKVIKRLRDYTVFHFNSEEDLMRASQYPRLAEHASTHSRLKNEVKDFQRDVYEGKSPSPATVMAFLKTWLLDHILNHDREFARFLRERPKEESWAVVGGK